VYSPVLYAEYIITTRMMERPFAVSTHGMRLGLLMRDLEENSTAAIVADRRMPRSNKLTIS
jgi:hypothetical protein